MKSISFFDRWVSLNILVEVSFLAGLTYAAGWGSLVYLFLCSVFSIGLHPVGARWIQEHYTLDTDQETFSYYGWGNKLAFNVGYHNEHHDFPHVPWSRLPAVRAAAPEFYDGLYSHQSWTKLLFHVLFSPEFRVHNRIARPVPERLKDAVAG